MSVELAPSPHVGEASSARIKITEIFHSLQGEARDVGKPTVFVRLTGCPLRCAYCDTTYSFTGGAWRTVGEILEEIAPYGAEYVCVTGGEPLAQKNCLALLESLCERGYRVSLETSGALDISKVDARVSKVMDLKTPSSNEMGKNLWPNLAALTPNDQVKFVIGDAQDYAWAKDIATEHDLPARCEVLFSPVYRALEAAQLADWILRDRLKVRLQVQLHKLLWGEAQGR